VNPDRAVASSSPVTRVWDLPTRLFHWALAVLVAVAIATAKIGGNWMDWHMRAGYAVLALLLFRLLWGFAGSRYARFANFVHGPRAVLDYLRGRSQHTAGHNPLGALSVLALLAVFLVQAGSGLFASDDIFSEGPLAKLVSTATMDLMTTVHKRGEYVIYALIGLHLAAVAFYEFVRREPLIMAMVSGDRRCQAPPARDDVLLRLRALLLFAVACGLVWFLVTG
jgi:cytochrome b